MQNLQKPVRITLSAQIVEQMERCIRDEIWPVGSKIPGEIELMESFGVSRNTVREATLSLVHSGLLSAMPGDGTYVVSKNRLDAAMQRRFKDAKLREILETRLTLEVSIVELACRFGEEADFEAIDRAYTDSTECDLGMEEFIQRDTAFHLRLAEASHNRLLYDMYNSCILYIEEEIRIYQLNSENYRQQPEHRALCRAVLDRDMDTAVSVVRSMLEMERKAFTDAGLL